MVIVLASLAFLAALALAFLASIGTELKSSKRYADGASVQLLAQSAYGLVQTQIMEGSKGYPGSNKTTPLAWASQPGMIRTYTSTGDKASFYRLYSWDTLVVSGDFDPVAEKNALNQWDKRKAIFTDLNEPIKTGADTIYPIIDGNNLLASVRDTSGAIPISGKTYDSDGDGKWDIEGFNVDNLPTTITNSNPVPMPVKWLYVLADGSIQAAVPVGDTQVQVSGASDDNPIVGRVAFWADDESSKININTASDGVYWDTPRVKSHWDDILKVNQPVTGEYQRYPGHPAMTSLSAVIKHPVGWNPGTPIPYVDYGTVKFNLCDTIDQWIDEQWAQKLYGLAPRIGTGGSFAGSIQTAMLGAATPPAVSLDGDRLYASVDELVFKPNRLSNNSELANLPVLNKASLERAKFFLTASSRAPDVNLFNEPRVCIWPLSATNDNVNRTAFDRLIAFCSTLGGYGYYFQRSDPNSATADLNLGRNRQLLTYLRTLADQNIPGFGGNFSSKYPNDKDQIFTEIFDYIRCTNLRDALLVKTPETNSKSYTKGVASGEWDGMNGAGQVVPIVDSTTNTRGFGRYPTLQGASILFIGQVKGDDPLVLRDPVTHASIPTPDPLDPTNPAKAKFPASTSQVDPASGKPLPVYDGSGTIVTSAVAPGKMRMQAIFIPQFFCPSVGAAFMIPNFQWSVDLSDMTVNGTSMGFPGEMKFLQNKHPQDEAAFGDQLGIRFPLQVAKAQVLSIPMDVPTGTFTLRGKAKIKIYDPAGSVVLQTFTLNFNGPVSAVPELAYDHVANKNGYGVGNYDLPNAGGIFGIYFVNYRCFSSSRLGSGRYNPADPDHPITQSSDITKPDVANDDVPIKANEGGRFEGLIETRGAQGFIIPPDAIRSVRLISGDPRIVAGQENPPEGLFEANPTADKLLGAHDFFTGYGQPYYGAGMGKLVKDLAYYGTAYNTDNLQIDTDNVSYVFGFGGYSKASDNGLNGVQAGSSSSLSVGGAPGDWDNGPFAVRDGPYINKADEGDSGANGAEPYFWNIKAHASGLLSNSLFSPNRQIPSAVTFGSLPTGVKDNRPWQTLLFRPGQANHPALAKPTPGTPPYTTPPDHLLLELFSMPVVEPYAISEPMSTAGRINMNYQIMPFTYINRDTGIRALLKAEKVVAINDSQVQLYKRNDYSSYEGLQFNVRFPVNVEETLNGFKQRFDTKDIFRSGSEICDLHIVPKDDPYHDPISGENYAGSNLDTYATMAAYWNAHRLTGDNSKERIYATLYPRLTTKSNTFTIYTRVQTLKKIKDGHPDLWTEGRDKIIGQYRGYQTVERYIDPNASGLPDYTAGGSPSPLGDFYKIRTLASKQFGP